MENESKGVERAELQRVIHGAVYSKRGLHLQKQCRHLSPMYQTLVRPKHRVFETSVFDHLSQSVSKGWARRVTSQECQARLAHTAKTSPKALQRL